MLAFLLILFAFASLGLIVAALFDIAQYLRGNVVWGVLWIAIIFTFPVLGSICYFQFGVKQITERPRKFNPDLGLDESEFV